jgi:hypothetical protein
MSTPTGSAVRLLLSSVAFRGGVACPHLPDTEAFRDERRPSGGFDHAVVAAHSDAFASSALNALDLVVLVPDEATNQSGEVGLRRPLVGPPLKVSSVR